FVSSDQATTDIYTLSLHDALPIYLHTLEVVNVAYRLLAVEVAYAAIHPGQADYVEFGIGNLVEQLLVDLAVDDLAHVLVVAEHERHVEGVDVGYHRAESAEADAGHLHR